MKQIRTGVFETNSSSSHSISICTETKYLDWVNGRALYDNDTDEIVHISTLTVFAVIPKDNEPKRYLTRNEWEAKVDGDSCVKKFTTPSGDKMVAFGGEINWY